MSSAHRILNDIYRAFGSGGGGLLADPGDTKTITTDMQGQICSLTSGASPETRTLAAPTKPGIQCAVVLDTDGGGAVTLTVPGGYNLDADEPIIFADAGDYVVFLSVKVGTSYLWRALAQEGTTASVEEGTFDTVTTTALAVTGETDLRGAAEAWEHGTGAIATYSPVTKRWTQNGEIITEIQVDVSGYTATGAAAKDVIALASGTDGSIHTYAAAVDGIVHRIEMICVEVPTMASGTTLNIDFDLGADDQGLAQDETADDVVINAGDATLGQMVVDDAPALTEGDHLFLIEGGTVGSACLYGAGQFIIRLYGHAALSLTAE